jgi:glycosyltransferase involved in cell wall biosynthesis
VLPTLNEGCCNAIVEALACGLPIVSSDRPFNYDILNKTNSILVDPMNINEIADAIRMLKENSMLRARLSEGALNTAKDLTINRRATKIMDFIKQHI